MAFAPAQNAVHACALVVGEAGVLIRGASGAGKSALTLALLEAGARAGLFARLVADDRVLLKASHGRLLARPHPAIAGRIEKRGEGLASLDHEPGAVLRCVVDLVEPGAPGSDHPARLPAPADALCRVEDVELPRLVLPVGLSAADGASRALAFARACVGPHGGTFRIG
jgi:HPr kinase/phosphorylase